MKCKTGDANIESTSLTLVPVPNLKVRYRRGDTLLLPCSSNGSFHGWVNSVFLSTLISIPVSKQAQTSINKHQSMGQALREPTEVVNSSQGSKQCGEAV